jgi:DNA-directed RNA polymerase subunit M/transcription elongation factor TFIIS
MKKDRYHERIDKVCPNCNKVLVVENLDLDGKTKRLRCFSCGYEEIIDNKGRKLLTDNLSKIVRVRGFLC